MTATILAATNRTMTATSRRLLPTALKVAAVLSAIAIATFLILRAQRDTDAARTPPATDVPGHPAQFDGFGTSKSLVIDPKHDQPTPPSGFDDFGLSTSKSVKLPSPTPSQPQQPKKQ